MKKICHFGICLHKQTEDGGTAWLSITVNGDIHVMHHGKIPPFNPFTEESEKSSKTLKKEVLDRIDEHIHEVSEEIKTFILMHFGAHIKDE